MIKYKIDNRTFILSNYNIGIISDVHFNHELTESQLQSINKQINDIVNRHNISTLIFNGDTFTGYPFPKAGIEIIENINTKIDKTILIKGNHEEKVGGFGNIFENTTSIKLKNKYIIDDIVIFHGHLNPPTDVSTYIIGHLHPTKHGNNNSKPIHLHGTEYINGTSKDVFILPSFTGKTTSKNYSKYEGTDWIKNLEKYQVITE